MFFHYVEADHITDEWRPHKSEYRLHYGSSMDDITEPNIDDIAKLESDYEGTGIGMWWYLVRLCKVGKQLMYVG